MWNLIRWASPRTIKETFVPPTRLPLPVPRVRGRRRARRGPVRLLLGVVAAAALAAALAAPAGAKRITGNARANLLIGTAAPDRVVAGGGNDRIDVAGGGRDVVSCGPGTDVVQADPSDRLSGCETVTRRIALDPYPARSPRSTRARSSRTASPGARPSSPSSRSAASRTEARSTPASRSRATPAHVAAGAAPVADGVLLAEGRVAAGERPVGGVRLRARGLARRLARDRDLEQRDRRQPLARRAALDAARARLGRPEQRRGDRPRQGVDRLRHSVTSPFRGHCYVSYSDLDSSTSPRGPRPTAASRGRSRSTRRTRPGAAASRGRTRRACSRSCSRAGGS